MAWALVISLPSQPAVADSNLFNNGPYMAYENWRKRTINYVAINQDIKGFFNEFSRITDVQTNVSGKVRGRLQNKRFSQSAENILNTLSDDYSLQWYYDGAVLYITSNTEAVTRLIPMGNISAYRLREELSHLGLYDKRFTFRFSPSSRMIMVAGPPRYVATIEAAMSTLADNRNHQPFTIIRGGRIDHESVVPLQK